MVFEHRAPFYRILHTWCQDKFPLCYLCFLFLIDVLKIFRVCIVLPHSLDHSILVGRHLGVGGWSSAYSQVRSAQPQSEENCFPFAAL